MKTVRKFRSNIALSLALCLMTLSVTSALAQRPVPSQPQAAPTVPSSEENSPMTLAPSLSTEAGPVELTEQQMEAVQGQKVSYTFPYSASTHAYLKALEIAYQKATGRNASVKINWSWSGPRLTINFY